MRGQRVSTPTGEDQQSSGSVRKCCDRTGRQGTERLCLCSGGTLPSVLTAPPSALGGPHSSRGGREAHIQVVILLKEVVFKKQRHPHSWKQTPGMRASAGGVWDPHGASPPKASAAKYSEDLYPPADFVVAKRPEENRRASERSGFVGLLFRDKIQCLPSLYHLNRLCSLFNRTVPQRPTNQSKA